MLTRGTEGRERDRGLTESEAGEVCVGVFHNLCAGCQVVLEGGELLLRLDRHGLVVPKAVPYVLFASVHDALAELRHWCRCVCGGGAGDVSDMAVAGI